MRLKFTFLIVVFLFSVFFVNTNQVKAAATCSDNTFISSLSFIFPTLMQRGVTTSLSINGTNTALFNQTVYIRIVKANAFGGYDDIVFPIPVTLNSAGSGIVSFTPPDTLADGLYIVTITGMETDHPLNSSCTPQRSLTVSGGPVCKQPSTPCTPCSASDTDICSGFVCTSGCVTLPVLNHYECAVNTAGRRVCRVVTGGNFDTMNACIASGCEDPDVMTSFSGTCGATGRGIDTAIGCVPLGSLTEFATFFLRWALGISGGVGFLFLIYASFLVMTSSGDPTKLQTGKELLVSTVSGIILLIFSVFVLRLIGVNLLGLF